MSRSAGGDELGVGASPAACGVGADGEGASVLARRGGVHERVPADLPGGDQRREVFEGVGPHEGERVVRPGGDVHAVDLEPCSGVAGGGPAGAAEQIQQKRPDGPPRRMSVGWVMLETSSALY